MPLRVNLDDPIALLAILALAVLGLAGAWLAGRWSRSKWLNAIALVIRLIILVELILLAATTIFTHPSSSMPWRWRRAIITRSRKLVRIDAERHAKLETAFASAVEHMRQPSPAD